MNIEQQQFPHKRSSVSFIVNLLINGFHSSVIIQYNPSTGCTREISGLEISIPNAGSIYLGHPDVMQLVVMR